MADLTLATDTCWRAGVDWIGRLTVGPDFDLETDMFNPYFLTALGIVAYTSWGVLRWALSRKAKKALPWPKASVSAIREVVVSDNHEFRQKLVNALNTTDYRATEQEFELNMGDHRDLTLRRLKLFASEKLIGVRSITEDPMKFIAAHETVACCDPSFAYLFSVHYNLFGGSVLRLGTEKHHKKFIDSIDDVTMTGCFALTEFQHGVNSGVNLDTTAYYDAKTGEFVINTPHYGAQKHWISLLARFARWSVVFAQLLVPNDENNGELETQGVHAFLIRIREDDGTVLPSVTIADMGHKPCVNGNDNGRLLLSNVRVPHDALLDRFSSVDQKTGAFTSNIPRIRDRFLRVADQLVNGRMVISAISVKLAACTLLGAVNYSLNRTSQKRQVRSKAGQAVDPDAERKNTINIFQHLTQRKALLPLVAESYAMTFAIDAVKRRYANTFKGSGPEDHPDRTAAVQLVYAFKAYATERAVSVSGVCRDHVGGQALLSETRMCSLVSVAVSLAVVEGDARLLAQKCVKEILMGSGAPKGMGGMLKDVAMNVARRSVLSLTLRTPTFLVNVKSPSYLSTLFAYREVALLVELALSLVASTRRGVPILEAWSKEHLMIVMHVHRAYSERVIVDSFLKAIGEVKDKNVKAFLGRVFELYALNKINEDMAWFQLSSPLPTGVGLLINEEVESICRGVTDEEALLMAHGMGLPEELLSANPLMSASGEKWIDDISTGGMKGVYTGQN
eukprot:TRINITY_DN4050_c0_g1_i1.p1 TRINITY_DN4050_c0_g1~~TRINITY_DN4050_c0_g1_i1.p1  ORF type:complete len:735 (+),score=203.93 TRINITY_DN4050_c0_g1_i1:122-2326(+)